MARDGNQPGYRLRTGPRSSAAPLHARQVRVRLHRGQRRDGDDCRWGRRRSSPAGLPRSPCRRCARQTKRPRVGRSQPARRGRLRLSPSPGPPDDRSGRIVLERPLLEHRQAPVGRRPLGRADCPPPLGPCARRKPAVRGQPVRPAPEREERRSDRRPAFARRLRRDGRRVSRVPRARRNAPAGRR